MTEQLIYTVTEVADALRLGRTAKKSLVDPESMGHTSGAFAYRHSGLTLIAESVKVKDDIATIRFRPGGGLINGGHSQKLIREVLDEGHHSDEYVILEILTGVADDLIPEIADGRNTSLQVKQASLAEMAGRFDFLKEALDHPDEIIWKEGGTGSLKVEHLIALVSAFDIEAYSYPQTPQ